MVRERQLDRLKRLLLKSARFLPMIGLCLYAYIVWRVGITNVLNAFSGLNFTYLGLTPAFVTAIILLKGLKWKLILNDRNLVFSFKDACLGWCIGAFAGPLTPAQSGEAIKAFYVKRKNAERSYGECLATIAADKILELISLMVLVVLSLVLLVFFLKKDIPYIPLLILVCLIVVGLSLVTNRSIMAGILRPLARRLVGNQRYDTLRLNFNQFFQELESLGAKRRKLVSLTLLAIFTWLVVFSHLYILALSLRMDVSSLYMFMALPLITFIAILPVSVSGLGTRDAAAIFFFSQVQVSPEAAVTWSILGLATQTWILMLVGWFSTLALPPLGSGQRRFFFFMHRPQTGDIERI